MTSAFKFLKMNPLVFYLGQYRSRSILDVRGGTHLEMIEKTTGSSDNQINTLGELVGFGFSVGTSHQYTESLRVALHHFFCDTKDL